MQDIIHKLNLILDFTHKLNLIQITFKIIFNTNYNTITHSDARYYTQTQSDLNYYLKSYINSIYDTSNNIFNNYYLTLSNFITTNNTTVTDLITTIANNLNTVSGYAMAAYNAIADSNSSLRQSITNAQNTANEAVSSISALTTAMTIAGISSFGAMVSAYWCSTINCNRSPECCINCTSNS